MRLRSRLVIVILVASLPPLTILGYGAINTATEEVSRHVKQRQGDKGQSMAVLADTWMDLQLRSLVEQVSLFDLRDLEDEKLAGFLKLVFRQVPEVHIASIINREGIDLSPSLYLLEPGQGELAGKEGITEARFLQFREGFPDPDTARSVRPGVWLGRPYTPAGREDPVVPVLVEARDGDALLAVELALDGFTQPLGARSSLNEDVALLDGGLRPFLNGEAGLVDVEALEFFLQSRVTAEVEYTTAGGVEVLAACAPIESTGWFVVVAVTGESTKAAGRKITQETVFWAFLAAVLSVVLGMMYARDLSVPVVRLKNAVVAVSRGDFGRRVSAAGGDELVSLTRAFNLMSTSLDRNRQEIRTKNEKIEAYTREIEAYNRQLEGMVEERTRELREAQEKLVQSARLAAVGEMGAGLAHELNNPLTGILGMTQVVRSRLEAAPESEMLETVEELALRCSQIVSDLLHFYREGPGDAAVDPAERDVVDL
ncbi:MAG: histidine kinase dimerization/phospho-acceptor domain-containing protein, partial [Myxococcota bacterium]|nr:histidine kinase dimerization/phospho-acceptor domain-containing protein [Myxococcota bacterium]